jgi:hypothetical protein
MEREKLQTAGFAPLESRWPATRNALLCLSGLSIMLFMLSVPTYGQDETISKQNDYPWKDIKIGEGILKIDGEYRLRGEAQKKFNIKTYGIEKTEDFLLSRLRLNFDLHFPDSFQLHLQIQDAEETGVSFKDSNFSSGNNPFHDPFDINQAYVELPLLRNTSMTAGRQSLSFGDRRVFGPGDWSNTGRYAWDAILIRYKDSYIDSNWIAGRYVTHDPHVWPNRQVNGVTALATYNTIKNLPFLLDVFYVLKYDDRGITKGEKTTGNLTSQNVGFRIDGKSGQWNYETMMVKEFGKWASDSIDAYGMVFTLGYTFDMPWKPHLIGQYIIGSGDSNPGDGKHGTFSGMFGGADTVLYGWMNLFFWENIREHRLDLVLSPQKDFTLRTEYHYFTLDKTKDAWYFPGNLERRDKTGTSGRELGHEIDLTAKKNITGHFEIQGGYCFLIPGKFVKNTGKSPIAQWYFLQTTFYF